MNNRALFGSSVMSDSQQIEIEKIYRAESARVLACLIRILGDLDLAEEALHEAFSIALQQWPHEGIPQNPYAWLVSTGKFKAIDALRKIGRGTELLIQRLQADVQTENLDQPTWEKYLIDDDLLRLIFFCCHPELPLDSRIALSLREVCGLSTEQIARGFLVNSETIKKRISRAKSLLREKAIPFEIPSRQEMDGRVNSVLQVIYLVFNEGYSASSGEQHLRKELTQQAIFLGRKLVQLAPTSHSIGLLALLLLQESRREARVDADGNLLSLEQQDRSRWDKQLISEGLELLQTSLLSGVLGSYTLQAAIASVHAQADSVENTRWQLIVDYYDMLLAIQKTPIVEFNRAIAVGMNEGPRAGLDLIEALLENPKLSHYHSLYAAQAEFCKQLGLKQQAIEAYQRAIDLVRQQPEERYLKQQLSELQ